MRLVSVLAGLALVLPFAVPPSSDAAENKPIQLAQAKLVGVAAWNTLVGNSISGKDEDEDVVEYYAPDGSVKSRTGNETSTGTWALVGEIICFKYPGEETDCYKVDVDGDKATFTDKDGEGTTYDILKGNPKGL
jgi:hypothetical protein